MQYEVKAAPTCWVKGCAEPIKGNTGVLCVEHRKAALKELREKGK